MSSRIAMVGVILFVLTGLFALSGCDATTDKSVPQMLSDASISLEVQKKLTNDRVSNFPRIDVNTEHGVVNLSGVVQTEIQRAEAARLAQAVAGVIGVNNNLEVQSSPTDAGKG